MTSWLDEELSSCVFKDRRLVTRFKKIIKALAAGCGQSIPQVCEEWAMAKATYRFLSNERVDESEILTGHFHKTGSCIKASDSTVLILHDTCEFTYSRDNTEAIGHTRKLPTAKRIAAAFGEARKACGILMHASCKRSFQGVIPPLIIARYICLTELSSQRGNHHGRYPPQIYPPQPRRMAILNRPMATKRFIRDTFLQSKRSFHGVMAISIEH